MLEGIKNVIKGVFSKMINKTTIQKEVDIDIAMTDAMSSVISLWSDIYKNQAPWLDKNTSSMNLGASIANEFARLVTLELETRVENNDYLQEQYERIVDHIREYTEYACAKGGLVFKPYVDGNIIAVDAVQADNFFPCSFNSRGEITSAVFVERIMKGKCVYTRLEHHSLEDNNTYIVTNKAYMNKTGGLNSDANYNLGEQIPLTAVDEWASLEEETIFGNMDKPLFAYFRIPGANNIETSSCLGVSVYSRAVDAIKEADRQYSRILWEFEGSELAVQASAEAFRKDRNGQPELPKGKERLYNIFDFEPGENNKLIDTFSPAIRDSSLYNGLNQMLRKVEYLCGLAYGTISDVNETDKTATEIKASKQRSYSTVKDIQKALERALEDLMYAVNVWAILLGKSTSKELDITFKWDDSLVMDKESELLSMQQDVACGLIRPELYIMKKYGVSEEEALKMMPQDISNNDEFEKNNDPDTGMPRGGK